MIKKRIELEEQIEPSLKNGHGNVKVINILQPEEMAPNGRLFAMTIIPPHGSIGPHQHNGDFETYIITKGVAEINDNGKISVLREGDVVICKDGDSHGIRNIGDSDLEYVALILFSGNKSN